MKVMAVDFGEKRIGLAISDPAGRLAVPLTTVSRSSDRQVIREIAAIATSEKIKLLIVGEPRRLDGTRGEAAERARVFAGKLAQATELPCRLVDEALTSREAESRLRESGVDPRRHPERVDAVAAQILLEQTLLETDLLEDLHDPEVPEVQT